MKALIVIDIEDKAFEYYSKQNSKALTVDMIDHVGERGGFYSPKFLSLKPMPTTEQIKALLKKGYGFMSFEELLDEITGETE